jgi:uncharacterized OB-fold protein
MNADPSSQRIPIIEDWLNIDMDDPHIIGNRCNSCGEYYFPRAWICRNPGCTRKDLTDVPMSTVGKVWSFTLNYYEPPPPYVPVGEFKPYAIVVAELLKEKLMVMGPLADGYDYDKLTIGMSVEMILEPLYRDAQGNEVIIWKWKPLA